MASDNQKCPSCGRSLQPGRPDCIYCGYELPMDSKLRTAMKKNLVARTLGSEEAGPVSAPGGSAPVQLDGAGEAVEAEESGKCPSCGEQMKPDFKFCTSCGASMEPQKEPGIEDVPERHIPTIKDFIPPIAKVEYQRHLSGFPRTKDNMIFLAAAFCFVVMLFFPFGLVPAIRTSTVSRPETVIGIPGVLLFLYLLNAVFVFLANFRVVQVTDIRRMFIVVNVATIVICVLLARNVFFHPRAVFMLAILLLGGHFYLRYQLREFPAEEFWTMALLMSSGVMLLLTPYIRTITLADTNPGLFANQGFIIHFVLSILMFTGAIMRKTRIDVG